MTRLVASWLVLTAAVVGVGLLLTRLVDRPVDGFDDEVARWFRDQRTPDLDVAADVATYIGNTVVGGVTLAVLAVVFGWWTRSWRPTVFLAACWVPLFTLYVVVTTAVPRQRPPVRILDPGLVADRSFPSGHVLTEVTVCGALAALLWAYSRVPGGWLLPLGVPPVLTLLARLYQGAHHLTDVLTSLVVAGVWLLVVSRALLPQRRVSPPPAAPARR